MTTRTRATLPLVLVALVAASALAALALHAPIPQPAEYHAFADARMLFGIPNFANVTSNLAFVLVGALGLREVLARRPAGIVPGLEPAYVMFFAGTALVALGSGWYHLAPDDATLVWDRLPMAIGFMSFVAVVIGERFDVAWGRRALPLLVAIGLSAVLYWRASGDLRLYLAVQFVPMLLVPAILLAFPARLAPDRHFWLALAAYALAKVCESHDAAIYSALHGISGHTLKHLVAALGLYAMVRAVRYRRPRGSSGSV